MSLVLNDHSRDPDPLLPWTKQAERLAAAAYA